MRLFEFTRKTCRPKLLFSTIDVEEAQEKNEVLESTGRFRDNQSDCVDVSNLPSCLCSGKSPDRIAGDTGGQRRRSPLVAFWEI